MQQKYNIYMYIKADVFHSEFESILVLPFVTTTVLFASATATICQKTLKVMNN